MRLAAAIGQEGPPGFLEGKSGLCDDRPVRAGIFGSVTAWSLVHGPQFYVGRIAFIDLAVKRLAGNAQLVLSRQDLAVAEARGRQAAL